MQPRIMARKVAPGAIKVMNGLEAYLEECGLEPSLLDLVRTRASQINGCAYCIDMHTKDARARGEIATMVGKSEENCCQIARRARQHLKARRPHYDVPFEQREQLTHQFIRACVSGDMDGLLGCLLMMSSSNLRAELALPQYERIRT
jgi:AhpD family alkylhydroperoxidase